MKEFGILQWGGIGFMVFFALALIFKTVMIMFVLAMLLFVVGYILINDSPSGGDYSGYSRDSSRARNRNFDAGPTIRKAVSAAVASPLTSKSKSGKEDDKGSGQAQSPSVIMVILLVLVAMVVAI